MGGDHLEGLAATPSDDGGFVRLLATPGVTEVLELRSTFGFMAFHGGELEAVTDIVAAGAAEAAGASYYGVLHPAGLDVHLPSTRFRPADSPALARFIGHVDIVVAVHGYGRRDRWTQLLLGGANRDLAVHLADHLGPVLTGYQLVTDLDDIPTGLRGLHRDNPVNLPPDRGVQIELPPRVRGRSPLSPPAGPDGLSPPTAALIRGLAEAARAWPAST